jgi:hypothetical protein
MLGECGVYFSSNQGDGLDSFVFSHRHADFVRFEHFLSEVVSVLLAQNFFIGIS